VVILLEKIFSDGLACKLAVFLTKLGAALQNMWHGKYWLHHDGSNATSTEW